MANHNHNHNHNHYQKFADVIRDALDYADHRPPPTTTEIEAGLGRHFVFSIRNNLANVLADDNTGFSFVKFANACNPNPTKPT